MLHYISDFCAIIKIKEIFNRNENELENEKWKWNLTPSILLRTSFIIFLINEICITALIHVCI